MHQYGSWARGFVAEFVDQARSLVGAKALTRKDLSDRKLTTEVARIAERIGGACRNPESTICQRCPDRQCHVCTRTEALMRASQCS